MTKKENMLETLTALKGIGKVKAEALINDGFDTVKKIQQASIEELTVVKGISESVASSIKDQLGETHSADEASLEVKKEKEKKREKAKEIKEPEKEVTEERKKEIKKPQTESTDEPKDYIVKKKPSLTDETKHFLYVRKEKKKHTPRFLREEWFRYKRIPKNWHRPNGISSKMRMNKKYRPSRVRVGFRGPKKVRGLHPSGFEEVIVYNVSDLKRIDANTQAARISATVGTKKRVVITDKAKELDIRLLNK